MCIRDRPNIFLALNGELCGGTNRRKTYSTPVSYTHLDVYKRQAQDIVNWTPTIISAAQTIDATVATLDPANAAVILLAGTTFTAAATLVEAQAKTYLANPTATALQPVSYTHLDVYKRQL